MCGIAGILGSDDRTLARRMAGRIAHRGPDGEGLWSDDGVVLAHRRLAIIDLESGQQPMTDPSGRWTIVYNGEVYNHLALRAELQAAGHRFRTHSDTEAILLGWAQWGPRVLDRLEGMFAFALWDAQGTLTLARDRWGIKPLHYTVVDGCLLFASEAKAFLAHPGFKPEPDWQAMRERLALEYPLGNKTLLRGVRQVPPGHCAAARPSRTKPGLAHEAASKQPTVDTARGASATVAVEPWVPGPGAHSFSLRPTASVEQLAHTMREALVASVKEQLMSEVPLGLVLSGGLDSAVVAQAMAMPGTPSFTVAGSEDVADLHEARALATVLGTDHHEAILDDAVMRGLGSHIWSNEVPSHAEVFFRPLFDLMARHVKVGLCGQGSDELWGGYARYKDPAPAAGRVASLRLEPGTRAALEAAHATGASLAKWDQGAQLADFQLRLVDRSSMAHGLEVRVPFLSTGLQALSDAVPWDWKVRDGVEKWVLRKAAEDLGLGARWAWRPKVPAGRATAPVLVTRFEADAAAAVDARSMARHPLADAFAGPADYATQRAWEEIFLHGRDPRTLDVLALG